MLCVNSITVIPRNLTIKVGEWYCYASAEVCPECATCKDVVWISSNTDVASVNETTGYIMGMSAGTARVYAVATDGSGISDYIDVCVSDVIEVNYININETDLTLEEGSEYTLIAEVYPKNATNRALNWRSSNTNVAEVNGNVVRAISQGYATITACSTDGSNICDSCNIHVTKNTLIRSIEINALKKTLAVGESIILTATICPDNAAKPYVVWSSNAPDIVSVNPDSGLIYANKAGSATISATAKDGSGVCACCTFQVNIPVNRINIYPESLTLDIGDTEYMGVMIYPSNATNKKVYWESECCDIADVDRYGYVTAKSAGTTYVYAIAQDGSNKCGRSTIIVKESANVTVISCIDKDWINSSETMGDDMAEAMGCDSTYIVQGPTTANEFENYWSNVGPCVVIHTHGSPTSLGGQEDSGVNPQIISLEQIEQLPKNNNIDFVMMTACSTAGGDPNDNVAYHMSKKINSNGIVIANKYTVSGSDDDFGAYNDEKGWVVYRNGVIIRDSASIPARITMEEAYEIYKELV